MAYIVDYAETYLNSASTNIALNVHAHAADDIIRVDVAQSSAAPGSAWATSLVVVQLSQAQTASITYQGPARLEIQVDDGSKTTWWHDCEIKRGNIS